MAGGGDCCPPPQETNAPTNISASTKPSDCAESLRYRDFLLVGLIVNRKDVFGSNRLTSYKLTSSNASLEETRCRNGKKVEMASSQTQNIRVQPVQPWAQVA